MKRITLRQLRVFEQVARLRSISAAAGVCHLTQPAVSMQLKALEQECELPLTELIGRQLRLTDAGEAVATYARRIQHEMDELDQRLAAMRGQQQGKLNVGIVSTAKYFASHMLAFFTQQHPGVELSLQVEKVAIRLARWSMSQRIQSVAELERDSRGLCRVSRFGARKPCDHDPRKRTPSITSHDPATFGLATEPTSL